MSFHGPYYKVYMPSDKKSPGETIHNSGSDNVQLALNPATKRKSLECNESKAGPSGVIVSDRSNKIKTIIYLDRIMSMIILFRLQN